MHNVKVVARSDEPEEAKHLWIFQPATSLLRFTPTASLAAVFHSRRSKRPLRNTSSETNDRRSKLATSW